MRGSAKLFFLPPKLKIMHANTAALMEAICRRAQNISGRAAFNVEIRYHHERGDYRYAPFTQEPGLCST